MDNIVPEVTVDVDTSVPVCNSAAEMASGTILRAPVRQEERNYKQYYVADVGGVPYNDHFLYRHANGLCIVGLAPGHAIFREDSGGGVGEVEFTLGSRKKPFVQVTGKFKRNALHMDPASQLAQVKLTDGRTFTIRCCVKGSLLEINNRVVDHPAILHSKASSEGYFAILMPRVADWPDGAPNLLTTNAYCTLRSMK